MELNQLSTSVNEKLQTIGYELVSLKTRKEKDNLVLEVVVDRVEPIDMNAIVEVSNVLNAYFDEVDPFDTPYVLDISSLGAEKPLKIEQLDLYKGSYVNIHIVNPIEGWNIQEGTLEDVKDDSVVFSYRIKNRVKTVDIQKSNISKIRLAIKF